MYKEKRGIGILMENSNQYYNNSVLRKGYTILILLLPITMVYASPIPSVSFGEIIILLFIAILLGDMIMKRELILIKSPFLIYLMYALLVTVVSGIIFTVMFNEFSMTDSIQRMIRDTVYFAMALLFAPAYFDFQYGIKVIRKIIFILGIFVFIQFIVYAMLQVYIPGIIPQMKTTISGGITGAELIDRFARNAALDGFARPNGFLKEPASIAQFVSVGLLLELFPQERRVNFKRAIFYSFVMLITLSVNAYVALLVCWSLWALYTNRGSRDYFIRIILFVLLLIIALILMMQNPKTASIINRLIELKNGGRPNGSSAVRVMRGMAFYFKMPPFYEIFGSGFGNFLQFKSLYNISTIYELADEYMNTNAYILISSGIVGFGLYLSALVREAKQRHIFAGMIALIILTFGLSSSIYSSDVYVIMLAFFITTPKKGNIYEN